MALFKFSLSCTLIPAMTAKRPRAYNSTLPAPSRPMQRGGKLRATNPEREAKRRKRRGKQHAAYRASETFKIVHQRAAGRCEGSLQWENIAGPGEPVVAAIVRISDQLEWEAYSYLVRCTSTGGLEHHHRTYARFGGRELPEDMIALCKRCHAWIETHQHPHRRNGR